MKAATSRTLVVVCVCASVVAVLAAEGQGGPGGQSRSQAPQNRVAPVVASAIRHDVSAPLRTLVGGSAGTRVKLGGPLRFLKSPKRAAGVAQPDGALQTAPALATAPTTIINFEGVNNVDDVLPPDTNGDIGPNHFVQWVNKTLAIYSRTGALLYGPVPGNAVWAGFGGACESQNDGDPIVLYDHLADRWLLTQFALPNNIAGVLLLAPFYQCIAVSQTSDPTGAYYRYQYEFQKLNDYPKFGVWSDGYYMSINQFAPITLAYAGQGVAAFDRAAMLAGQPARMIFYDLASVDPTLGGMLPSDLDGPAPPAGSPNFFVQRDDDADGYAPDQLQLWRFQANWSTPGLSSFTGPHVIPVAAFDANLCDGARNCIPQPGTTARLDAMADRLMYRLQYRNFGTHQSLIVNHTVDVDGSDHAGIRWYEVRDPGGTPVIHQQGTFAPDGLHRWMGSAAMDAAGNIAIAYNAGGATLAPSIRYAGRLATDPPGVLAQGENDLITGTGSQTHTASRWGDYSMLGIDPIDGCTFWATSEYMATTSLAGWQTRIGAFRLPGCGSSGPPPAAPAGLVANAASASRVDLTWADSSNDETGFSVERCTGTMAACDASGSYVAVRHLPADTTLFGDAGLLPATTYTYRVRSYNYGGHSDYSNAATAATAAAPTVSVTAAVATAQEAGPVSGGFTITRGGLLVDPLTVSFALTGTAAAGDYQPVPLTAVIPAGASTASVAITPVNDAAIESDETVILTIASTPAYVVGGSAAATVTIVSDDRAVDLVVAVVTPPATAASGGTIQVSDTTTNQGPDAAAASVTSYYLSANYTLDAGDPLLGTRNVPALSSNASSSGGVSVTLPTGLAPGSYGFFAKADAPGLVTETNEFNNTRMAFIRIGPDLLVTALSVPATVGVNVPFSVTETTANQGGGAAEASVTQFYLSTDFQHDANDVRLQSRSVGALAGGASQAATTVLTIPAGVAAGSYFLIARADDSSLVSEHTETNNTRFASVRVGGDLVVSTFTVPQRAATRATIVVSDTTTNSGSSGVVASTTAFYLSTNFNVDAGDIRLSPSRAVPALAAGASSGGSTSIGLPDVPAGTWYLIAAADADHAAGESNEANNSRFAAIQIGPDLGFFTISAPTTAVAGAKITVTDTVRNYGAETAGASTIRYYLSVNPTLDAGDTLLEGHRAIGPLAAGTGDTGSSLVTLPTGMTGQFYLLVVADADGRVAESLETNNTMARLVTIAQ